MATPNCTDPGGASVAYNQGTYGHTTTVAVNQPETIMAWDNFNTAGGHASIRETVAFSQGDLTNSAVLSRISGGQTQFNGDLTGTGMRIFLVNPAGIIFGSGASINVSQLVASSLNISNDDFTSGLASGVFTFTDGLHAGDVTFQTKADKVTAERLYLIGKNVINNGGLVARDYVVMAAGDRVVISESGSNVAVEVFMPTTPPDEPDNSWTPDDFKVRNFDAHIHEVEAKVESKHIILAAGDVFSAAYINAYSDGGSDAAASVEIKAAGNVDIEDDITAKAVGYGDGTNSAIAGITITAGGALTIESDGSSGTKLVAEASDGVNNSAEISLTAAGAFTIDAPDMVTVQAEAGAGKAEALLNQANVNIAGGSVLITATDDGRTDAPATVYAYAHDAVENRAGIDIQSAGDVEIIGAGEDGDKAIIKAEAQSGSVNTAQITINAAGDVDIIAENADAQILAYAHNGEDNTANVDITAGGDVTVKSEGGDLYEWQTQILVTPESWDVKIKQQVLVTPETWDVKIKQWQYGSHYHYDWIYGASSTTPTPTPGWQLEGTTVHHAATYTTVYDWIYGASSQHPDLSGYPGWEYANHTHHNDAVYETIDHSSFTPYVASVEAIAENALNSNTAGVDITAGGDAVVLSKDGGEARVEAYAGNALDSQNTATINLTAKDGYVLVHAIGGQDTIDEGYYGSEASVKATAEYAGSGEGEDISTNDATITIVATDVVDEEENGENDGDVMVVAVNGGKAEVEAIAKDGDENSAGVDITADSDVKVIAECEDQPSQAEITALAKNAISNTADVDIAAGGDVKVIAKEGGDAEIEAIAKYGFDNTATVGIDAVGGDVLVLGTEGGDAAIKATAEDAENSNTADVTINATATTSEHLYEGDEQVYLEVDGGDVKVIAVEGGDAAITAFASDSGGEKTNTANVTINATAAEGTMQGEMVTPAVYDTEEPYDLLEAAVYEAVAYTEGGDVKVIGTKGGEAEIEALAIDGVTNVADVLICIDGGVKVEGDKGGEAEIEALAKGWDSTNTATVGICAKGDDGIEVIADRGGEAGISSKAKEGENNTASTIVCTGGGVDVTATNGGDAKILAQAETGITNNAYVGIGAMGDVVVQTGEMPAIVGCDAVIRAEAETGQIQLSMPEPGEDPIITTADAEVVVFSHEGSVKVLAYNGGHSGIEAEAQGAHLNTAKVGVAAGADLSPADVALPPVQDGGEVTLFTIDGFGQLPLSGNVIVEALNDSEAQIMAWAHDAGSYEVLVVPDNPDTPDIDESVYDTLRGENTANVVICAPGEVRVSADQGSEAKIKSMAGQWWDEPSEFIINSATTQVYASEVKVDVPDRRGNGISALADGIMVNVPDNYYDVEVDDGRLTYCLTTDGAGAWTDGSSTVIVDDYANRKDCPTCPPCPCEKEQPVPPPPPPPPPPATPLPPLPPAPLSTMRFSNITERVPEISGCPGIVAAATGELGITPESIQVAMANSMASASDIQPCDTCARLVSAAAILKDADGSRLAALLEAINTIAPANVPFTPEIGAQIATVFEGHKGDGTAYASALEYVDAFVQYVKILDNEMGSPVGDSVAFTLEKHGQTLTASDNANVAAFVASRLEQVVR